MVSQVTEVVDQSASNLAVVTNIISKISNVTLSSPDVPVSNNVCAIECVASIQAKLSFSSDCHKCCFSTKQYPDMASHGAKYKWLSVNATSSVLCTKC